MTSHFAGIEALVAGGVLPEGGFTGGAGGFCAKRGTAAATAAINESLIMGGRSSGWRGQEIVLSPANPLGLPQREPPTVMNSLSVEFEYEQLLHEL